MASAAADGVATDTGSALAALLSRSAGHGELPCKAVALRCAGRRYALRCMMHWPAVEEGAVEHHMRVVEATPVALTGDDDADPPSGVTLVERQCCGSPWAGWAIDPKRADHTQWAEGALRTAVACALVDATSGAVVYDFGSEARRFVGRPWWLEDDAPERVVVRGSLRVSAVPGDERSSVSLTAFLRSRSDVAPALVRWLQPTAMPPARPPAAPPVAAGTAPPSPAPPVPPPPAAPPRAA